ncbi:hypothetical protein M3204_09860 [Mesobacillus subterraneus]|nr:hypothetical protein [Mesobacillus subterraneus]
MVLLDNSRRFFFHYVQEVCLAGAHAVTANEEIIEGFLNHPSTMGDVEKFKKEWDSFY